MKLSTDQIAAAKAVLGADPLPQDHPVIAELEQAFGPNTFYLDQNGLLIFQAAAECDADGGEARLVLVAAWSDEQKSALGRIEPVDTGITVALGAPTDSAAPDTPDTTA
ncbi:hypothetical protein LNKW23_29920 [Paralimibaculum aggregatum]|uniref:Uncharacterized protein n=1 Tax=Paralimibaculum aggregatum TaxID=3036245 RepID=A0ABQ6LKK6_9RHOB|nr:hypothetical protein [Limibaculum sp. NKW23]GMG83778.1 hypothetical protein LNKW23_29920 [Limibaculum sp. NKW23]